MLLCSNARNKGPFPDWCSYNTLCFLSRVFSQLCSGDFPTGSGRVLLSQRFPGGTKGEAARSHFPAVWLWWIYEGLLQEKPPWHWDKSHTDPREDQSAWETEGETVGRGTEMLLRMITFLLLLFTDCCSVQRLWFDWRLAPKLFIFDSWTSQEECDEDAWQQSQGATL